MSNDIGDSENDNFEDSYFDDAIIEIANEIEQIKAIKMEGVQKSNPPIALNVDMGLKKVKHPSINIFPVLKTLHEEKIYPNSIYLDTQGPPSTVEQKYYPHKSGSDQKYHPLIIKETTLVREDIPNYHILTLEDLFEDPKPEEKPLNMPLSLNSGHDAGSGNEESNNIPQTPSNSKLLDKNPIKTVNIPNTIAQNLDKQLKKKELELFQNFLKLQRK